MAATISPISEREFCSYPRQTIYSPTSGGSGGIGVSSSIGVLHQDLRHLDRTNGTCRTWTDQDLLHLDQTNRTYRTFFVFYILCCGKLLCLFCAVFIPFCNFLSFRRPSVDHCS